MDKPTQTTKAQVIHAMQNLYSCMDTTARIMDLSRMSEIKIKAHELRGARDMLKTWIDGVSL